MKELSIGMLIAVLEEIFGRTLFWGLVVAGVAVLAVLVYLLLRERSVKGARLLRAELWALPGALAAILFVQFITDSGFADIGGPVDLIVLILIGLFGAVGLTVLVYVAQGLRGDRGQRARGGDATQR